MMFDERARPQYFQPPLSHSVLGVASELTHKVQKYRMARY